jgi:hypothetical protein
MLRVLIIDDDEDDRMLFSEAVKEINKFNQMRRIRQRPGSVNESENIFGASTRYNFLDLNLPK